MKESIFEASIASRTADAKRLAEDSLKFINQNINNPSPEVIHDIKLVLCELLYNAVIHGNNEDEHKKVSIKINLTQNKLCVKICDEGKGFDYNSIFSKNNNLDADSLFSENGRGILLVKALVDELSFNKTGNIIEFSKKVVSNG